VYDQSREICRRINVSQIRDAQSRFNSLSSKCSYVEDISSMVNIIPESDWHNVVIGLPGPVGISANHTVYCPPLRATIDTHRLLPSK